jgi:hypothetical protein
MDIQNLEDKQFSCGSKNKTICNILVLVIQLQKGSYQILLDMKYF